MRTLLLFAVVSSLACIRSYESAPALSFSDVPYTSVSGQPWQAGELALTKAEATWKLGGQHRLRYVELNPTGSRTLLFLHGLGSSLKFWRYQLDTFAAQGFRVIAIDQLGFGKSDKPAQFPYSMDAQAEVVVEVVEALKLERVVLVGHSMGGEVALATAIRFPEKVEALVLTSPAGFEPFSPREKKWFEKVFSASFVKSTPEYGIWGSVRYNNFVTWKPEYEWLIEERVRLAKSDEFDAYAYAQVRAVDGLTHNDFVRESLGKVTQPTLIVFGEDDRLIPNPFLHGGRARRVMEDGASKIRGSTLVGLARCGHTVQMDCAEPYNAEVRGFLSKLPAPAAPKETP
ncbi:MAG: alpha/beta hydrolase [Myxococcaceae bacterium]|jgi:pimeloyl-ACP methyl ester carboxylesterase|nr:alpha/beta hydrolase [Myxococcaceae bacterium]